MAEPRTPTLSARERDILLAGLAPFADRIERVGIFGSRALGRAAPASDIDLVLYGAIDEAAVARIWSRLADSSLAVTVDVVRYSDLPEGAFRRHIDLYAVPLFDRADLSVGAGAS